jgi:NADH dehydrogenase
MKAVSDRVVTVLGGTGFLGRRIVRHLRLHGFCVRVASRHPDHGQALFPPDGSQLRSIKADVHDERSVADALADAYGAVNAVSLYIEQGQETFHSVHVEPAQRVAAQAQRAGVKRLIHVSGIGAAPSSPSLYVRKRGEGELAVQEAFTDAILIRPAVMFGPDDAFPNTILKLLERLPIYPMFGNGVCSQSTWKMLARRSQRYCKRSKLPRLCLSSVALASTPTKKFLKRLQTQPALSPN